ncbi:hypothetical protein TorRG33x02_022140 [Trema orientale]|uniref:Uncharacterized protein n=1 Tax=Trema orientale TaxID=63057 RepID=A0A2P5FVV8_TREOI|nr:hypothetical protein TorRG33x02_022140 [Trema orientale]
MSPEKKSIAENGHGKMPEIGRTFDDISMNQKSKLLVPFEEHFPGRVTIKGTTIDLPAHMLTVYDSD